MSSPLDMHYTQGAYFQEGASVLTNTDTCSSDINRWPLQSKCLERYPTICFIDIWAGEPWRRIPE